MGQAGRQAGQEGLAAQLRTQRGREGGREGGMCLVARAVMVLSWTSWSVVLHDAQALECYQERPAVRLSNDDGKFFKSTYFHKVSVLTLLRDANVSCQSKLYVLHQVQVHCSRAAVDFSREIFVHVCRSASL